MWAPLLLLVGASPSLPLTFDAVLGRADAHPRLEATDRALAQRERGDANISRLSSNPQLQVLPEWRLPGASDPGFEVQASLSQTFDLGGIGPAQQRAAARERASLAAQRRAEALALRLDAGEAWLELWARRAQHEQILEEREIARELAERLARAVTLGAALDTDAIEAELFAQTLGRAALDAEGRSFEQALQLAGALGLDGRTPPVPEGEPPAIVLPEQTEWDDWIARAGELPGAAAARFAARAAQARTVTAAARSSTRLTPTVTAQWERPNDVLVFAGLGVQIPMIAPNQRAQAVADAAAVGAEQRALQATVTAQRDLRMALHEVVHSREIEAHMRTLLLPTAERWVAGASRRFSAGESDVLSVLRARRRLAEVRVTVIEAEQARRWAELKAWLLLASLPSAKASS